MGLGNGEVNWEKGIKMGSENQMGIEKQNVHIQYTYIPYFFINRKKIIHH